MVSETNPETKRVVKSIPQVFQQKPLLGAILKLYKEATLLFAEISSSSLIEFLTNNLDPTL